MGKNKDRLNQKSIPWADSILDQVMNLPPAGGEDLTDTVAEQTTAVEELMKVVSRKIAMNNGEGQYVWKKYAMTELPDGYTYLPHITSTGSQYFDTGIVADANTKVRIKFGSMGYPGSGTYCLFGSAWGDFAMLYTSSSAITWYGGSAATVNINSGMNDVVVTGDSITINGVTTQLTTKSTYPNKNLCILNTGDNANGSGAWRGYVDNQLIQIYSGDALVRNYVGAKNSSGAIGFYDLVNNTFTVSASGTNFVEGTNYETFGDFVGYVVSSDEATYPNGGEKDGYWYELVKDELRPEMLGFTKMAVDKFTFTSRVVGSTALNHSLGEFPEMYILVSDNQSTVNYDMRKAAGICGSQSSIKSARGGYIMYYNGELRYGSAGSSTDASVIRVGESSACYFTAGVEYTLYTFA